MAKSNGIVLQKTLLCVPKNDVRSSIRERIAQGKGFKDVKPDNEQQLAELRVNFVKWNSFNEEFLKQIFNKPANLNEYLIEYQGIESSFQTRALMDSMQRRQTAVNPLAYQVENLKSRIGACLFYFDNLSNKIDLIPEIDGISKGSLIGGDDMKRKISNTGFLIHGHNSAAKYEVSNFVEKELKKEMIILHEQPSGGMTIIEKFEKNTLDVDFAIGLWTADDMGSPVGNTNLQCRARQNVVFETGFFFGKLGRGKVIVLREENVEIFTDYSGIAYIPFNGNWKNELRKEIEYIYRTL